MACPLNRQEPSDYSVYPEVGLPNDCSLSGVDLRLLLRPAQWIGKRPANLPAYRGNPAAGAVDIVNVETTINTLYIPSMGEMLISSMFVVWKEKTKHNPD